MKCYYHPEEEAVGQCVDCGKFLCKECASKYKPVLCDDCYETRRRNNELDLLDEAKGFAWGYIKGVIAGIIIAKIVYTVINDAGAMGPQYGYEIDQSVMTGRLVVAFLFFLFGFGLFSRSAAEYVTTTSGRRGSIIAIFFYGLRFFFWIPKFIKSLIIIFKYR